MTPEDLTKLKARVEQALALSVKAVGTLPTPKGAPTSYHVPMDRCWAFVNVESTQGGLTDRAVRALGGSAFTVVVDDAGITITPTPAPSPASAPPPVSPAPATH